VRKIEERPAFFSLQLQIDEIMQTDSIDDIHSDVAQSDSPEANPYA
jgi:hypothetical protein